MKQTTEDTKQEAVVFGMGNTGKVQVMDQAIVPDTFDDSELPNDIHIVTYKLNGEVVNDVVRAYTKVDIFDVYYDNLKGKGEIISIKSGYGRVKPKLYGKIKSD